MSLSNTVEQLILDAATTLGSGAGGSVLREDPTSYRRQRES